MSTHGQLFHGKGRQIIMHGIQGKTDGTLGRIARIEEELSHVTRAVSGLPFGMEAHFMDAFNRLSGAFLAGSMTSHMFGTNVGVLIRDAESMTATEERRRKSGRREFVRRAAVRAMRREVASL